MLNNLIYIFNFVRIISILSSKYRFFSIPSIIGIFVDIATGIKHEKRGEL